VQEAGATPCARIGTRVQCLVIGGRVPPATWRADPWGEEIQEAIALRDLGHPIAIVGERQLLERLG
jgi:hypothetical protein